jgi:hypothetical protein
MFAARRDARVFYGFCRDLLAILDKTYAYRDICHFHGGFVPEAYVISSIPMSLDTRLQPGTHQGVLLLMSVLPIVSNSPP